MDRDEGQPREDISSFPGPDVEDSQLEIHASIGGELQHPTQEVTFMDGETGEEETQEVCHSSSPLGDYPY